MIQRLVSLLKIKTNEGRLVLLTALLFACIQAGQGLGDNASSALFLLRYGVDFLPYMYVGAGTLTFVITMLYSAGLGRFDKGKFFTWLIIGFGALLIVERFIILTSFQFIYPAIWLTVTGMGFVLGTFVWNLAGEVCDARQAKRLFPIFTSAGILGSVGGNAITGFIATQFGAENLLVLYAILLGVAFFLTRSISTSYFHQAETSSKAANIWQDIRSGFDFVRSSPMLRLIAYSSILFSILFFTITYPFSKVITESFPTESEVAGFLGTFSSITTATTFFVSLFLANRIFSKLGVTNGVFLMPLTYVLSFAVFISFYNLNGAVIARFSQLVILGGIAGTAWNALFNVVPSQKRGQVLAFINGVPSQIGVILSGFLLIFADQFLTVQQIFFIGVAIALICGMLIWGMRRAYGQALIDALRAGRLEVFSENDSAFSGFRNDASALNIAIKSLDDPKATTRRLAAEILGKMEVDSAAPALTRLLSDPEPDVRASALSSLKALHAPPGLDAILKLLHDDNDQVRLQTLKLIQQLDPSIAQFLKDKLIEILHGDSSVSVQMQAAVSMTKLGLGDQTQGKMIGWLNSCDPHIRLSSFLNINTVASELNSSVVIKPLLTALDDQMPQIRRAAATCLGNYSDEIALRELVAHLNDLDDTVCKASAESLRKQSKVSSKFVLEILETNDHQSVDYALDSLPSDDPSIHEPLMKFALNEIENTRKLQSHFVSISSNKKYASFLRDLITIQLSTCESRLVKTIGFFGDMKTMDLVRKGMSDKNPENRAAALEALDTIGDKQLAKSIVAILEEEPQRTSTSAAIESLISNSDRWLRLIAVQAIPELELRELIPLLHKLKESPDELMQEAALRSLSQFGEVNSMDTLNTVSILERIMLLREIPIFADLSPEDLKSVAEIAREEFYPQDTDIFHQGDEGSMMYVIVEGHLHVLSKTDDKEHIVADRGPGEFVGEMAVIESAPRSATLRTAGEVRVLSIDGETFKGILHERPDVSFAVLRNISRRLRETMAV